MAGPSKLFLYLILVDKRHLHGTTGTLEMTLLSNRRWPRFVATPLQSLTGCGTAMLVVIGKRLISSLAQID
jgi:hypothetical protein